MFMILSALNSPAAVHLNLGMDVLDIDQKKKGKKEQPI